MAHNNSVHRRNNCEDGDFKKKNKSLNAQSSDYHIVRHFLDYNE